MTPSKAPNMGEITWEKTRKPWKAGETWWLNHETYEPLNLPSTLSENGGWMMGFWMQQAGSLGFYIILPWNMVGNGVFILKQGDFSAQNTENGPGRDRANPL